jgi:hypothetical protein
VRVASLEEQRPAPSASFRGTTSSARRVFPLSRSRERAG